MAIHWTVVAYPEIIKNHARREEALQACFRLVSQFARCFSADPLEKTRCILMQVCIGGVGDQSIKVICHGTHIFGDRPFVVIENNDEPLGGRSNVVEGLECDAAGESCISRDADHMLIGADLVACRCHAECRRERCPSMPCAIGVVLALAAQKKTIQAFVLADCLKTVQAPCEKFVHISLVADIKYKLIPRRIEDPVQRDGQFHHAKIRAEMAAGL